MHAATKAFANTLHSDGSVEFFFSGFPDYMLNIGSGTPGAGSWTCRADEKLVVNVFTTFYVPATVNGITDLVLSRNLKDTYLFTITDQNTLTRVWNTSVVAGAGLKFGFSTDMQAFVIGAIVGSSLTAIIGYFYGSTRASAAKDITIDAIARQKGRA